VTLDSLDRKHTIGTESPATQSGTARCRVRNSAGFGGTEVIRTTRRRSIGWQLLLTLVGLLVDAIGARKPALHPILYA
jgi:hypothetical protein